MKNRQRSGQEDEENGFVDRLIAAILAPFLFNFGNFILLMFGHRETRVVWKAPLSFLCAPLFPILAVLPVVMRMIFGTNGVLSFLGHAFYTHVEKSRICGLRSHFGSGSRPLPIP